MRVKYHERRKISVGTKVMLVIAPLALVVDLFTVLK